MARIRSIKPEFPQSESMGRVSRDARLLFIELWTICDDEGRTRAASRMLASLLFPYDDDAPTQIDGWLAELETEGCIVIYRVAGSTYLQICNWLNHQKIDKPSKSKIPPFSEGSESPRESSRTFVVGVDQGVDQGREVNTPPYTPPIKKTRQKSEAVTLATWLADVKAKGEKPVSDYKPLWEYVEKVKLPHDFIELAWLHFRDRYTSDEKGKRKPYTDWRGVFLKAVKFNWFHLWFWSETDQGWRLTTVGIQADKATEVAA